MAWTAWQYREVYDELYASCDKDTQRSLLVRLDRLLMLGNQAKRPVCAPLRDGIFELRAKKVRLLFYFRPGQQMIFVVGLIKDTNAVPSGDIDRAVDIRSGLASGMESVRGITNTH